MARFLLAIHGRWAPPGRPVAVDVPWNDHGSRLLLELMAAVVRRGHGYDLLLSRDPRRLKRVLELTSYQGILTNWGPDGLLTRSGIPLVHVGGGANGPVGQVIHSEGGRQDVRLLRPRGAADNPTASFRQEDRSSTRLLSAVIHSEGGRQDDRSSTRLLSAVILSEGNAMEKIVAHLRAFGYRRIGWASIHAPGRRFEAWKQVMAEHGMLPPARAILQDSAAVVRTETMSAWRRRLIAWLQMNVVQGEPPLDAVVCDNDGTARFLLELAPRLGIRVPQDLGLTGVDGRPDLPGLLPITTVVQDPAVLARTAVQYIEEILAGRSRPGRILTIAPVLRPGGTTAIRRDPVRERRDHWLQVLDKHLLDGDPAGAMAGVLGLERAYLLRRFADLTGTSLPRMVSDRRLDLARDRLRRTRQPLRSIALECGFESPATFHRRFKARFGESPGALREKGKLLQS